MLSSEVAHEQAVPFRLRVMRDVQTQPGLGFAATGVVAMLGLSVLVGGAVLAHPGRALVGWNPGSDFQVMTWSLVWWPWAIGHGIDPLRTHLLWAPGGFPTIWLTAIPAVSLIAAPLTLTLGPVVTYNVLMFAAVGLAAACAFLLCRELTGRVGASFVGGLLFGLSPYMVGHTLSQHLDLTFVWPVPLIAWAIVRLVRGAWRRGRSFVLVAAALLMVELGASLELSLDLALVLGLAFVLAVVGAPGRRGEVLRVGRLVGLAYCAASPFFVAAGYMALTSPHTGLPYPPASYSTDLANVAVPTPLSLFGSLGSAREVARHFVGNIGEQDGYLGLPVIAVTVLAARARWRQGAWLAVSLLVVVLALSLGPVLTVSGHPLLALPFATAHLPLLADMLPARLSLFAVLVAACLVAVWLSLERRAWMRVCAAVVVVVSVLPNPLLPGRVTGAWAQSNTVRFSTLRAPAGFASVPGWSGVVRPGATVLVIPTGSRTDSLYWQAESKMRFRLATPATPFVPAAVAAQPTVVGLTDQTLPYLDGDQLAAARLRAYLAQARVGAVVVSGASERWRHVVATATGGKPRRLAGAFVYVIRRLPPLAATGELSTSNLGRTCLRSWLRFDGRRAHVEADLAGTSPVTVSAPAADAEQVATAVGHGGRAAIAFTEWQRGTRLLAVATRRPGGGWQTVVLDRREQPIWSPRVRITPDGTVVASWLDVASPLRLVRVAVRPPHGSWRGPTTLEDADGLAFVDIAPSGEGSAVLAWRDTLGSEERVRVATYTRTGWRLPVTAGTALSSIGRIRVAGRSPTRVVWTTEGRQHIWVAG